MKKVTFSLNFSLNEKEELCIPIDEIFTNTRIIEASLKIQADNFLEQSVTAKYIPSTKPSWVIDKLVKLSNDKMLKINISDELQDTIDNLEHMLRIKFEGADFENEGQCSLYVKYIPLVEFQDKNKSKNVDLKTSGSASVNLASGELSISTPLVTTDNNTLPLSIYTTYNKFSSNLIKDTGLPNNWRLNLQQYLVKNEDKDKFSFTYVDENGKEQLIEESYYYLDNEAQKVEVARENLIVNLDGEKLLGENKLLKNFDIEDLEKYEIFDTSENIAQIVKDIEKFKAYPYTLSLNLNIGDEIVEYRCNNIQVNTVTRSIKIDTGNTLNPTILTHEAKSVKLTFKKDDKIIKLIIDSDPTDSNTLLLYKPLAIGNPELNINYFYFLSNLENVKSAEVKLNEVKIYSTTNSLTGFKVVSSISEISGAKLVDYEPTELKNLREQLKQLQESKATYTRNKESLKTQVFVNCLSKYYSGNSIISHYIEDAPQTETNLTNFNKSLNELTYKQILNEYLEVFNNYFGDNKIFSKNDLQTLLSKFTKVAKYKQDQASKFKLDGTFEINAHADFVDIPDTDSLKSKVIYPVIGDLELFNNDFSLENSIEQYKETDKKLKEIDSLIKKYNNELTKLEMQVPVHYLYNENNIIYGFGRTKKWNEEKTELVDSNIYRLILITDPYENSIFINYQSPEVNRIENVTDSAGKTILFSYDKDKNLEYIIDSRDRKVEFKSNNNNLESIIHVDGTKSFYYDNNENFIVLNSNGYGAKFDFLTTESNYRKKVESITSLSALESIINGKIKYKEDFNRNNLEYSHNFELSNSTITFNYNNYKSTTVISTLPNQEVKKITYLFDRVGFITAKHENEFSESKGDNLVKINEYSYYNDKLSSQICNLLYSDDYLSDVSFKESEMIESDTQFFSNSTIIGENLIPYKIKSRANFHTLEPGKETAQITMSDLMLEKLKNDELCKHKTFMISGWAKADSAFILTDEDKDDYPNYDERRKFAIEVSIKYKNKLENEPILSQSFDWRNTDWQYCSVPVTLNSIQDIESITCYINYSNNIGNILFSDLSFQEADWQTSQYLTENNSRVLVKDSAHSNWLTKTYFDDNNNLPVKDVYINKTTGKELDKFTTYQYTKQGKLLRTISYNDIVKENIYNDKGSLIKSVTYHLEEPATKFYEEQKLDDKNNIIGKINVFGEDSSNYEFNDGTNIITIEKDIDGTKTAFGYDQKDRIFETSVTINGVKNSNVYGYVNDLLASLKHNDFEFKYDFDDHGRITQINIANGELSKMYLKKKYDDFEQTTTLGNGEIYRQTFDCNGNVVDTFFKKNSAAVEEHLSQNIYDTYGNLIFVRDLKEGENLYKFFLDKFGNKYREESNQHENSVIIENSFEDSHSNVTDTTLTLGTEELNYHYTYSQDKPDAQLSEIELSDKQNNCIFNQSLYYDKLGRISSINTNSLSRHYSYLQSGDHASSLVSKLQFATDNKTNDNLTYSYDNKGNITEIRGNNALIARYKYDGLSRIVREDNKLLNKTYTFTYDAGGNILERTEYTFTLVDNLDSLIGTSFTFSYPAYGWKDQLMEYDGKEFIYDALGNPTTYKGLSLNWSHGRQLDKFADIAEYKYNAQGIRVSKFSNGFTTKFFLNGNKIICQQDALNTLYFHYGADGLTGFSLNGIEYLYKKNLQNDIIGIYSTDGTQIARYSYDAWGNQKVEGLANNGEWVDITKGFEYNDISDNNLFIAYKNPFRYRSYYYDFETNLYYLNSRYYDPETGRFINADDITILNNTKDKINGLNLYAYCLNNPINTSDENGDIPKWLKWLIGGLIIAVVTIVTFAAIAVTAGAAGIGFGAAFAGAFGIGGATSIGGFAGFMAGVTIGTLTGSTIGLLGGGFTSLLNGESFWDGAADGFMWGAISGAISGGISTLSFGSVGNFGYKGQGNFFQVGLQGFVGLSTYIGKSLSNNEKPTFIGMLLSLFGGITGGLLNNARMPIQIFVSGGVEFIGFLTGVLKKMWKLPNKNPIMQIT